MPTDQAYDPLDFSSYTPDWAGGEDTAVDVPVLPSRTDDTGYASQRRRLESGGKSNAKNPNSSAYGPDQFLKGTWMELIDKYKPSWSRGKSEDELLELRADPDKSAEMVALFDQDNADYLAQRDIPATNMNLYLAHHFGKGGAAEIVESPDDTPMRSIVSPATYKANPHLHGKTKGEVLADFERRGIDQGTSETSNTNNAPTDPLDFSSYTPDWAEAEQPVLPRKPDFTGVTSEVTSTAAEDAGLTSLDTAGKAFAAGAADVVSDIMYRDMDAQAAELVRKQKEEKRIAESALPEGLARILHTDILSPITSQIAGTLAKTDGYKAVFSGLDKYLTATRAEVAAETADIMSKRPVQGYVERAITDVAGSPQSLASIPGGIFAAIPAATSYNDAYRAAREAGATPEDANEFAELQAATEGGISAIPAGKVLSILGKPFAKKAAAALVKPLTGRLARVARTAVGESIEEAAQTVASDAVSRAQAESADGEEARAFAAGRISQDLLSDTLRSAAAGAVGGTALGAPHAQMEYAVEAGKQAAETTKAAVGSFNKQRDVKEKADIEFDQDLNRQLAAELAKTQAREAQDKLDQEAAAQKAVEEEAGFRTLERDNGKPVSTIVRENREGVLTREPIAPAREVLPEDIITEEPVAEKPAKAPKKVKAPKPKAQPRTAPVAPPVKSDRAIGDKEIADLASQLGVTLGMRETLTLNKGESAPADSGTAAPVKFDRPAFESKVGQIVKGLVKKNRQDTADVQNLIRQEKLVLAPNPETIGRTASENAAEYDPETNQMYIYTDRVDPKDTTGVMARALHEATHAGQFNDREGRPDLFKQMMSSDKENAASKRILALDGKNTLATAAVAKAKAASPSTAVQDLELVPYFVTEAVKARGNAGRLSTVANDVIASARTFMRDKLGVDLDVSLDDLASAAQQVGGEIVRTDTSKKRTGNTLAMIAGPSATGFKKAQSQGRTYRGARDFGERFEIPDNQAELTTDKATFNNIVAGETTPLSEVLAHDALYEQYPDLKKVNVKADPEMVGGSVYANYDPETNSINVNPILLRNAVAGESETLRNKILHETQHAIQTKEGFVPGANAGNFIPRSLRRQAEDASAKFQKVVKDFDLGRAVATLNSNARNMWDQNINSGLAETRDAQAQMFLEEGFYQDSSDRMIARYGDRFKAAQKELNDVSNEYFKAEQKAFQTYLRDYGETEARTTEARSRKTNEELAAVTPEENMATAEGGIPVERTIDSTPFVGGIRQAPESRTLGMAQEEAATLRQKRTPSWLTGLFDSAQGVGRSINEVIEFARSSPAEGRMVAEASLEKYDIALRQLANERDTTPEALNKEISAKLDEIDAKQDGFEANRAAFNAVASQYGAAGQAMVDLRNQIDDLTLDIIRQRAANGNPLTEAEQKKYKTLLNNLGRYSHRQYAVNSGDMGKKYSKVVWKDYENAKKGNGLDKERVRNNYEKVDKAVTYLVDNNLYIPDDAALNSLSADRVRSLYNVWGKVGSPEGLTLEQMKEELAGSRDVVNGNKERLTRAAESITQELLGLADPISSVTNYYRGGKQDNSILKERKAIPPELRNLMGEIKDPAMRLMLTAGKQAEFVARNKMLLDLREMVGTEIQPPDAAGTNSVKGMQKLEGETWGPLEGYYVSKNMRNLVGDTVQQLATFEQAIAMAATRPGVLGSKALQAAFDKWGTVAAVSKVANIVGNPVNFLYNFIGAPRMMLSNGNLNPKHATKALQTSAELIAYAMNPATATEAAIEANKYGITDSAFVGEIKNAEYRQLQSLIKGMSGKNPNELWAKAKTLGVGVKELYAMMDVWSKLANFYHQQQVLTDFYKAEGVSRTQDQINREAADNTNRTNITYKRAAPLVKALERGGITQFGTYFYEVFRSEIANTMQGVDELRKANSAKTPEGATIMRVQAAKRLAGQATSWALTAALAQALSVLAFGDDDETRKDLRALLPEYMRNQDFIPIGTDAKGDAVLFNWSRIDPIGPVTDIMRSVMHEGATPEQVSKSIFDLYVAPRVGTQLLTAIGSMFSEDVRPSRKPTVQQVAPDAYTALLRTTNAITPLEDRQTKAWTNVVESFLPGIVNSYRDTNVRPLREDFASTVANAGSYLGASMYKLNPENAAKSVSMDYSSVLKNARKDVKEVFGDYEGGPTSQDLVPKILDLREKEKAAYDEARRVYKGMLAVGITPAKAAEAFKDNRLAGDVIKQVQSGRFESRIISKDSIGTYMKNEQAGKSRQEKKEIKKKWDNAWKLLSATDKELNEEQE